MVQARSHQEPDRKVSLYIIKNLHTEEVSSEEQGWVERKPFLLVLPMPWGVLERDPRDAEV